MDYKSWIDEAQEFDDALIEMDDLITQMIRDFESEVSQNQTGAVGDVLNKALGDLKAASNISLELASYIFSFQEKLSALTPDVEEITDETQKKELAPEEN